MENVLYINGKQILAYFALIYNKPFIHECIVQRHETIHEILLLLLSLMRVLLLAYIEFD
jgi:hypothetical protein